jgi:hypothetical protein
LSNKLNLPEYKLVNNADNSNPADMPDIAPSNPPDDMA